MDTTHNELSESIRPKENLKTSELRYRRLFETAKDGILLLDAVTGEITDANPFLIELLGYSLEELKNKELWEISPFKDAVANKTAFEELRQKKYIRYEELPLRSKSGNKSKLSLYPTSMKSTVRKSFNVISVTFLNENLPKIVYIKRTKIFLSWWPNCRNMTWK